MQIMILASLARRYLCNAKLIILIEFEIQIGLKNVRFSVYSGRKVKYRLTNPLFTELHMLVCELVLTHVRICISYHTYRRQNAIFMFPTHYNIVYFPYLKPITLNKRFG